MHVFPLVNVYLIIEKVLICEAEWSLMLYAQFIYLLILNWNEKQRRLRNENNFVQTYA